MAHQITMFTSSVSCTRCNKVDLSHGLKKRSTSWYCKSCFEMIQTSP